MAEQLYFSRDTRMFLQFRNTTDNTELAADLGKGALWEIPILDGSSLKFVEALIKAGICEQDESLNFCSVKKSIKVVNKNSWVKFEPADNLILTVCIDYPNTCFGKQSLSLLISKDTFQKELCDNRTFCLKNDIKDMRSRGFALGGSLDNAIVVDGYSVINPRGLKRKDEFVLIPVSC